MKNEYFDPEMEKSFEALVLTKREKLLLKESKALGEEEPLKPIGIRPKDGEKNKNHFRERLKSKRTTFE